MTLKKLLETHLENECVRYAEGFNYESVKLDKAKRGWPDRIFFGPGGTTVLVEFKRPGEKARPQQAARHKRLAEIGHTVHLIDNFDDFAQLIYC